MSVKLRKKTLKDGRVSLYLDLYHHGARWYETLNIHINGKKPTAEDKAKRALAEEIRTTREHELIVEDNGLVNRKKKNADFISFFQDFVAAKGDTAPHQATLVHIRRFAGPILPISRITTGWMQSFEKDLLTRVSNNSALTYLKAINAALNELVRRRIIPRNPWHEVPKHERLKAKDSIRTAWSIEQLQQLANTPCDIEPQVKQAYFFACFTGLRWSDVNGLQWSNIIRKENDGTHDWYIYFEQQKTEKIEYFPLSDQAIDILKERRQDVQATDARYVFPKVKETHPKLRPIQTKVWYALRNGLKPLGWINGR